MEMSQSSDQMTAAVFTTQTIRDAELPGINGRAGGSAR
jgi:hypothetical protein